MRSTVIGAASDTLRSFRARNFRLWFLGQSISMIGFFGHAVAQALLVLDLTGSGSVLGFVTALLFMPMLIVGPWAGVLSDRFDKRRLLLITTSMMMIFAFVLGLLVLLDRVTLGWVIILATLTGTAWAFDQPCRRTIVTELVDADDAANAVGLNGALHNGAKVVGPAVAGLMVAAVGIGWCFVLNAATSIAVIVALLKMNPEEMRRPARMKRGKGQIRDGFRYVWGDIDARLPLVMLGVVAVLSFNWNILIPLLAIRDLEGTVGAYALLLGSMSVGSVSGGLWLARRRSIDTRFLAKSCVLFGVAFFLLAVAPTVLTASIACGAVGASSMVLVNATGARLQLGAAPIMRGRVMSVFSMVLLGSVAVGGPLSGWVAERFGARVGLGLGAIVATITGFVLLAVLRGIPAQAHPPNDSYGPRVHVPPSAAAAPSGD